MKSANMVLLAGVVAGIAAATLVRGMRTTGNLRGWRRDRDGRSQQPVTDLNSASNEEFERIGFSSEIIRRIVENRPYRNKMELLSRMIIPAAVYGDIRHVIGVAAPAEAVKVA